MIPRALLAALLATAALAGCAAPQHQADIKVAAAPPPPQSAHRAVSLFKALLARPNELAPVTDDKPDPEAQREFEARLGQAAVPLEPAPTPPKVTAIALDDTRRGEAPGMKPAGQVLEATLGEGQRAATPVKLAAGDCATFIAQGGLGVIEVDLFLTAGEGDRGRIVAEDPATGPIAVIGGHGKCVSGAAGHGTEATLHAAVRRGAGVVLVREYKK